MVTAAAGTTHAMAGVAPTLWPKLTERATPAGSGSSRPGGMPHASRAVAEASSVCVKQARRRAACVTSQPGRGVGADKGGGRGSRGRAGECESGLMDTLSPSAPRRASCHATIASAVHTATAVAHSAMRELAAAACRGVLACACQQMRTLASLVGGSAASAPSPTTRPQCAVASMHTPAVLRSTACLGSTSTNNAGLTKQRAQLHLCACELGQVGCRQPNGSTKAARGSTRQYKASQGRRRT
jgi:hypothetical protein